MAYDLLNLDGEVFRYDVETQAGTLTLLAPNFRLSILLYGINRTYRASQLFLCQGRLMFLPSASGNLVTCIHIKIQLSKEQRH